MAEWHYIRHRAFVRALMLLIYQRGDFSTAIDESLQDLDERDSWNPDIKSIPDPRMFEGDRLGPDGRFPIGVSHELDALLTDLRGPVELPLFPMRRSS